MTRPVPLAIVGFGGMGRRHVHGLTELRAVKQATGRAPALTLAAVIDRDPDRATALADEAATFLGHRPAVATDLADAAHGGIAAAADVCTGTETHHRLGLVALGLDLLEKPLAATMRGGRLLIAAAGRTGRVLAVAENIRREPVNRLAHEIVTSGLLGEIRFVLDLLDLLAGGGDALLLTPWRHDRRTGGILLDVGVHHADVLEFLAHPSTALSAPSAWTNRSAAARPHRP